MCQNVSEYRCNMCQKMCLNSPSRFCRRGAFFVPTDLPRARVLPTTDIYGYTTPARGCTQDFRPAPDLLPAMLPLPLSPHKAENRASGPLHAARVDSEISFQTYILLMGNCRTLFSARRPVLHQRFIKQPQGSIPEFSFRQA